MEFSQHVVRSRQKRRLPQSHQIGGAPPGEQTAGGEGIIVNQRQPATDEIVDLAFFRASGRGTSCNAQCLAHRRTYRRSDRPATPPDSRWPAHKTATPRPPQTTARRTAPKMRAAHRHGVVPLHAVGPGAGFLRQLAYRRLPPSIPTPAGFLPSMGSRSPNQGAFLRAAES